MKKYILGLFTIGFIIAPLFSFAQVEYPDPGPSTTNCVYINNNLRYRDMDIYKSNEVSELQDFLQTKGYLNNEPTGYFGLLTLSAVRSFQMANNISATGYVGPVTRAKIQALTCGQVPQEQICCEIFGYGAYMIKTSSTYEMMSRNQCTTGAGFTGGGRNIVNNSYCASSSVPVISGTQGPQNLKVNETGTWRILATDSNGGDLSYSVDWGDIPSARSNISSDLHYLPTQQFSSFTHSYTQVGNYTVVFNVMNSVGRSASTSLSVNVIAVSQDRYITLFTPNGGENYVRGSTQTINWEEHRNFTCPSGVQCSPALPSKFNVTAFSYCTSSICLMSNVYTIANNVTDNGYFWQAGYGLNGLYIPPGMYKMKVCVDGVDVCDISDAPFTIQ